ncbi:DNA-binding protein [Pseudomonas aeruginosa]
MEVKFSRYDTADYLKTEDDIAAYIEAVMEEGGDDPAYVARALGDVARARNLRGLDKTLPGGGKQS